MIILYGGSFNPPTIAHYKIANYLIEKYKPSVFIFIPVGNTYNKPELIPFEYRYQMVKILTNKFSQSIVSDYENQFNEFKGTVETLNYFQALYPNDEIWYVIGADNLLTLHKWIDYQRLLKNYKFIVLKRDKINIKQIIHLNKYLKEFENNFIVEKELENMDISATLYRDKLIDSVVMNDINSYIYKHKLYHRGGKDEK